MKNIECRCGRARWYIEDGTVECKYCGRVAGTFETVRPHDKTCYIQNTVWISNVVDGKYWVRCEECETMIGYLKPRLPVKDMII